MTAADPFEALGLPALPDLDDEQVRAAWRTIAAATHPDRPDGGDAARYTAAAAAYAQLRTGWGRSEAWADLTSDTASTARTWRRAPAWRCRPAPGGCRPAACCCPAACGCCPPGFATGGRSGWRCEPRPRPSPPCSRSARYPASRPGRPWLRASSPGSCCPRVPIWRRCRNGEEAAPGLRTDHAIEVIGVPGGTHRDSFHVHPGLRRVDDVAAADVHGHVPFAVIDQQVTRFDRGEVDVRELRPLLVAVARYGHASGRPGGLSQPGAVETEVAGSGAAVHVGAAELGVGERDCLFRLGRGRPAVSRRGGAVRADRVALDRMLLRHGQAVQRGLLGGDELAQGVLMGGELGLELGNPVLGPLHRLLDGGQLAGVGEKLLRLDVPAA